MRSNIRSISRLIQDFLSIIPIAFMIIILCNIYFSMYPFILTLILNNIYQAIAAGSNTLESYLIQFCIVFILKNIFEILINAPRSAGLYHKGQLGFRQKVLNKFENISFEELEKAETLDIISRAKLAIKRMIPQKVIVSFISLIANIIGLVGVIVVIISFSPLLAIALVVFILPLLFSRYRITHENYNLVSKLAGLIRKTQYFWLIFFSREAFQELRVKQGFDYFANIWERLRRKQVDAVMYLKLKEARNIGIYTIVYMFGIILALIICVYLYFDSVININELASTISAILLFQGGIITIIDNFKMLQENILYVQDVYNFLDYKEIDNEKQIALENKIESIVIDNISFSYPNQNESSISNVNFKINKGEKVMIIGNNGSGKTTLLKLILGIYNCSEGSVRINGININKIDKRTFFKKISIIFQNFIIYPFSIKENIGFGNDDNHVSNLISRLDLSKYDTSKIIGKEFGGIEISKGESQRIAIGRGYFKSSELCIVDEPTSALDPNMEKLVFLDILNYVKNKTAIIVTHKMSLCKYMDKIIFMNQGKIMCMGNHSQLMKDSKIYNEFYSIQSEKYTSEEY
ncbi:ABC transporter ATP-binding protein [Listeria welshimeri]|nr:ABC transporter ATP-binding protein [Listeria welshimeri]